MVLQIMKVISQFLMVTLGLVAFSASAQVYDPNDSELRKSFEQKLSKAKKSEDRFRDVERIVESWKDIRMAAIFIVGGPHLYLNPQEVHTNSKDFLESLHDRFNTQNDNPKIFLRKLQNNVLKGETEDLVCHLIYKAKEKFPDFKAMVIGHSYGGPSGIRIGNCLAKKNSTLDLLVTVDTVKRPFDWKLDVWSVPWSVTENFHFHQKHGILRGPNPNKRPDGSTTGIENIRQFVGKGLFNPHMYCFTNLVRYDVLRTLALKLFDPNESTESDFRRTLEAYIQKHPLE